MIRVSAAIIIKGSKILCAQRPENTTLPLLWEFPGGKIEPDESAEEALVREITEEMDCTINVHSFFDSTVYEYDFGTVELNTFLCTLAYEEPSLLEHHQAKWLTQDELSTLDWAPADIPAVKKLQAMENL